MKIKIFGQKMIKNQALGFHEVVIDHNKNILNP
jgi:hypothetical protein